MFDLNVVNRIYVHRNRSRGRFTKKYLTVHDVTLMFGARGMQESCYQSFYDPFYSRNGLRRVIYTASPKYKASCGHVYVCMLITLFVCNTQATGSANVM